MIYHVVPTGVPNIYIWTLNPTTVQSPTMMLRKLDSDIPMCHLGNVCQSDGKPHHVQMALQLITMAKQFQPCEIRYFNTNIIKQALHKLQDDYIYQSCTFAHHFLEMVKFLIQVDHEITPLTVLRMGQFLFACQGYKMNGEHQQCGRNVDVVCSEYATSAIDEARIILAWEVDKPDVPYHCKYFIQKLDNKSYTYGKAIKSLQSCLVSRNKATPMAYLHQSNPSERIYPRYLPVLGRVQFPYGDKNCHTPITRGV